MLHPLQSSELYKRKESNIQPVQQLTHTQTGTGEMHGHFYQQSLHFEGCPGCSVPGPRPNHLVAVFAALQAQHYSEVSSLYLQTQMLPIVTGKWVHECH